MSVQIARPLRQAVHRQSHATCRFPKQTVSCFLSERCRTVFREVQLSGLSLSLAPARVISHTLSANGEPLAKVPEQAIAMSAARRSGRFFVDQFCFCGLFRPKSSFFPCYADTSPGTAGVSARACVPMPASYVSKRNNWSAVSPRRPNMRWLITLVWPRTQICLPPNSCLRRAFARSAWLRSL